MFVKAILSNGAQWAAPVYRPRYSFSKNAGCKQATMLTTQEPPNIQDQIEVVKDYDRVKWVGRVEDRPQQVAQGVWQIRAVGHASHLNDRKGAIQLSDSAVSEWQDTPPVDNAVTDEWGNFSLDNSNRLFVGFRAGTVYTQDIRSGHWYSLNNPDRINQAINLVEFDYITGSGYQGSSSGRGRASLNSYTQDLTNSFTEWELNFTGATSNSTTVTITLATTRGTPKALAFLMTGSNFSSSSYAPTLNTNWFKILNVRVNGSSDFTGIYYYDDVIAKLKDNFTSELSTDITQLSTGTKSIETYYLDQPTGMVAGFNKAIEVEDMEWGFYDVGADGKPRIKAEAINRTEVDWIVFTGAGQANLSGLQGPSIQDQYNQVHVSYRNSRGQNRILVRTSADAGVSDPFADSGLVRERHITVDTTSQTAAQNVGDAVLQDDSRKKTKGTIPIKGNVIHARRGLQPSTEIRPNDIVYFPDHNPSISTLDDLAASTILNGTNIVRVIECEIDEDNNTANCTFDTKADSLDNVLLRRSGV